MKFKNIFTAAALAATIGLTMVGRQAAAAGNGLGAVNAYNDGTYSGVYNHSHYALTVDVVVTESDFSTHVERYTIQPGAYHWWLLSYLLPDGNRVTNVSIQAVYLP